MSELRKDPLSQQWVVITEEQARRVAELHAIPVEPTPQFDPFGPGNESKTPPEIYALREAGGKPNTGGWRVRVVPNKFPVLMIEGDLQPRARGVYDLMRGVGAHEIIIETPRCVRSLSELTAAEITDVLTVWQQRLSDLQNDVRLKFGLIFQNVGTRAGATLFHACSQLIATPVVPYRLQTMLTHAAEWFNFRGRSLFTDIVQQETELQTRVVMTDAHFLTVCPFASSVPFEVTLYPRRHRSHFEAVPAHEIRALGLLLKDVLTRIDRGLSSPPYNVVLYNAPFREPERPDWSWHLNITPNLANAGGFTQGTGFFINPVAPEDAAEFLRSVGA